MKVKAEIGLGLGTDTYRETDTGRDTYTYIEAHIERHRIMHRGRQRQGDIRRQTFGNR